VAFAGSTSFLQAAVTAKRRIRSTPASSGVSMTTMRTPRGDMKVCATPAGMIIPQEVSVKAARPPISSSMRPSSANMICACAWSCPAYSPA
jgi:hypothetical protein